MSKKLMMLALRDKYEIKSRDNIMKMSKVEFLYFIKNSSKAQQRVDNKEFDGEIEKYTLELNDLRDILSDISYLKELGIVYAIVYNYDGIRFGNIDNIELDMDNIMEVRYFSKDIEISLRIEDENIIGNAVVDNGNEDFVEENLYVYNKNNACKDDYNLLTVKKYIDYDEDEQAYFYYMKPCSFSKGGKNSAR